MSAPVIYTPGGRVMVDNEGNSVSSWANGLPFTSQGKLAVSGTTGGGYEFLGDYAAGIEFTEYNQIVRDADGEFWRVSGSQALPYTTTGAGVPESGALVSVGDAALRQELAVDSGSSIVTFLQSGTGAEPRSLEDRGRDWVSAKDYFPPGFNPTTTDCTSYIQSALDNNRGNGTQRPVIVPGGAIYRIDGCIVLKERNTLIVAGVLTRMAAHSASTRPVIRLDGSYTSVFGMGPSGGNVSSENPSPNGVVLWGAEDPTSEYVAYRWANVKNLHITTSGTAGDKGLSLQNSQFWLGGALYNGHFSDIWVRNATYSVYLNPIANGNTFHNINVWNSKGYSIYCDGVLGGLVTDNNFTNLFVDGSFSSVTMVYGRYVTHSNFIGMNGEPGAGTMHDIDSTCSRIVFIGGSNTASNGAFAAARSFYSINGETRSYTIGVDGSINSPVVRSTGGSIQLWNSASASDYNRLTMASTEAAYSGTGGVKLFPQSRPGSGTSQFWSWFADNTGTGNTRHNVVIDSALHVGAALRSKTDDSVSCGSAAARWTELFSVNGTINTSDEREKQDIQSLDAAELRVAKSLKELIKKFKFKDAVIRKGEGARIHVGVIAQDVIEAFENEGLDPMRYGIVCYDEWDEQPEVSSPALGDDGEATGQTFVSIPHQPAGNRYGVRYDEMLAFIIAAL